MCGIFCAFGPKTDEEIINNIYKSSEYFLNRRGPDHQNTYKITQNINNKEIQFQFSASVLHLQGNEITEQPIIEENAIFLFNGDVFDGIDESDRKNHGDTKLLFNLLKNNPENIPIILQKINGPYAFIYFDKINLKLYCGCDIFGRRSLLLGKKNDVLILTSVTKKSEVEFVDLPAIGTFCYDLKDGKITLFPRKENLEKLEILNKFLNQQIEIHQIPFEKVKFFEPNEDDLKPYKNIGESPFETLLKNDIFSKNLKILQEKLESSIQKRIINQPEFCQRCIINKSNCNHSTIGVLFSGGVDCTILACLVDKFYDKNRPIDLINVAFERNDKFETPDRETGLQSYEELCKVCPERIWNFIEVNVEQTELDEMRKNHIKHLIHPLNRILDDSLGCALWFAARGIGIKSRTYSRVLIVGMGADELFGGYCKQRYEMKKSGWKGLHESLENDWENISIRNLSRDDRVVSDHGRQLRTPYLDENLVDFVRNLPCWEKTYPTDDFPRGVGEKILLRTLAYKLGLKNAASFQKRALQFGCRIANSKENAFIVSPRLT